MDGVIENLARKAKQFSPKFTLIYGQKSYFLFLVDSGISIACTAQEQCVLAKP
jgi:hypothetical protein